MAPTGLCRGRTGPPQDTQNGSKRLLVLRVPRGLLVPARHGADLREKRRGPMGAANPPPPHPPSYKVDTPCPSPRTNRTRLVPHPVLTGRVQVPPPLAGVRARRPAPPGAPPGPPPGAPRARTVFVRTRPLHVRAPASCARAGAAQPPNPPPLPFPCALRRAARAQRLVRRIPLLGAVAGVLLDMVLSLGRYYFYTAAS